MKSEMKTKCWPKMIFFETLLMTYYALKRFPWGEETVAGK
jgi:hypothetical protein